jgi:cyanophycinase
VKAQPQRPGRTLVLQGGNEWRPGCEAIDGWWLERAAQAVVTVLTTAAQDGPERPLSWARGYFQRWGCQVEGCLIQRRSDARDQGLLGQLRSSSAVFLCGGDPIAARRILVGSPAHDAILELFRAGVPVVGSSAGAMVLGGLCLEPAADFQLRPGLGLLPGAVVVPHWNAAGPDWIARAGRLAQEALVLALDEMTGICWDGTSWQTLGSGGAVSITGDGERRLSGAAVPAPVE